MTASFAAPVHHSIATPVRNMAPTTANGEEAYRVARFGHSPHDEDSDEDEVYVFGFTIEEEPQTELNVNVKVFPNGTVVIVPAEKNSNAAVEQKN